MCVCRDRDRVSVKADRIECVLRERVRERECDSVKRERET